MVNLATDVNKTGFKSIESKNLSHGTLNFTAAEKKLTSKAVVLLLTSKRVGTQDVFF